MHNLTEQCKAVHFYDFSQSAKVKRSLQKNNVVMLEHRSIIENGFLCNVSVCMKF